MNRNMCCLTNAHEIDIKGSIKSTVCAYKDILIHTRPHTEKKKASDTKGGNNQMMGGKKVQCNDMWNPACQTVHTET